MYAVLEDAFLCFQQQVEMERRRIRQARQAEEWFFSDDFHWPFSFMSICDVLGLQPHFIRMKLRYWSPIPPRHIREKDITCSRSAPTAKVCP
jgi:hypothetical protein